MSAKKSRNLVSKIRNGFICIENSGASIHFELYVLVLTAMIFIVYWKYITGESTYTFLGIAADSYTQSVPVLIDRGINFFSNNFFSFYNIRDGFGGVNNQIDIFNIIASLGTNNNVYIIGLMQIIKVFLAGILFYTFLRLYGMRYFVSVIGGLCYSFSGPMLIRAAWFSYASEIVLVAFLLLSIEYYIQKKRCYLIPIALALIFIGFSLLHTFIYSAFYWGYYLFRVYMQDTQCNKAFIKRFIYSFLSWLSGLLISIPFLLPKLSTTMHSARVEKAFGEIDNQPWFSSLGTLCTVILKTLSNDILGREEFYYGIKNYLDDPTFYCGLFGLLLIPHLIINSKGKKKISYVTMLILVLSYCLVQRLRLLLNGFSKETFKLSSLWIMIVLLFLGCVALNEILNNEIEVSKKTIVFTCLIIFICLVISSIYMKANIKYTTVVFVFLVIYTILFMNYCLNKEVKCKFLLLVLTIFELLLTGYNVENKRASLTKDTYINSSYCNNLNDVMIKAGVTNKDSRISYDSYSLNDSFVRQYMGTRAYRGGRIFE